MSSLALYFLFKLLLKSSLFLFYILLCNLLVDIIEISQMWTLLQVSSWFSNFGSFCFRVRFKLKFIFGFCVWPKSKYNPMVGPTRSKTWRRRYETLRKKSSKLRWLHFHFFKASVTFQILFQFIQRCPEHLFWTGYESVNGIFSMLVRTSK